VRLEVHLFCTSMHIKVLASNKKLLDFLYDNAFFECYNVLQCVERLFLSYETVWISW